VDRANMDRDWQVAKTIYFSCSFVGIGEMRISGTWGLIFNNMVVLSRASWVQDDFERVCDEHACNWNEHKTVSAKQILNVVVDICGVSGPVGAYPGLQGHITMYLVG